ncbi:hypothetical protein HZC31_03925 [Candidatus Woesearchaeota archaeon]|nr:hypothetical protein [Candidatus Woesearchaeota archaeon]
MVPHGSKKYGNTSFSNRYNSIVETRTCLGMDWEIVENQTPLTIERILNIESYRQRFPFSPPRQSISFDQHLARMRALGEGWRAPYPWEIAQLYHYLERGLPRLYFDARQATIPELWNDIFDHHITEWTDIAFQVAPRANTLTVYVSPRRVDESSIHYLHSRTFDLPESKDVFGIPHHKREYRSFELPELAFYLSGRYPSRPNEELFSDIRDTFAFDNFRIVIPPDDGHLWPVTLHSDYAVSCGIHSSESSASSRAIRPNKYYICNSSGKR